jgi:hypothetical protein
MGGAAATIADGRAADHQSVRRRTGRLRMRGV